MLTSLTRGDVANKLGERPCTVDFKQANDALPDWSETAYTPTQMAERGVLHTSIIWAWLRPEAMGPTGYIKAAALMAERVLHIFEEAYPGDDRPRKAVEAALAYAADPSSENKDAARAATDAARAAWAAADATAATDAARAAAWTAAAVAARAATDAARAAWAAADATAATDAARAAEQKAQIEIIEVVLTELS